jgi:hypothetical protein
MFKFPSWPLRLLLKLLIPTSINFQETRTLVAGLVHEPGPMVKRKSLRA